MINILSSHSIYDRKDVVDKLTTYIRPKSKICVIAYSFFESGFTQENYEASYLAPLGKWYNHIVEPLLVYGIEPDNISWIIYHKDDKQSALRKIAESDIVFLPGGAPDLFVKRLTEIDILSELMNQDKIFMGPSAGTMIQFDWFHISKDRDYKKFLVHNGLGLMNEFGVEVHFRRRIQQKKSIRRVSHMHPRAVYAIEEDGFMIVENRRIVYQYHAYPYYEKGKKIKAKRL